ncbi:MAG: selenide, water dikinase SelD [Bacteroidales bacterium]
MKTDLLKFTDQGGCSSKIPPAQLEQVLSKLPVPVDRNILVNIDTHDDAGVYRLTDDLALVLTTDFFPPVCSDPYEFGQIAAANSISDVYAMGGTPSLALNIMMFPAGKLPLKEYAAILQGGYDKAAEAGVKIIGGHTIDDQVPKYGLAVTGFVNPKELVTNAGARAGQVLILTKPLGTGIILAGHRLGMTGEVVAVAARSQMKVLNNTGAALMKKYGVKGATDITGFGLAGHAIKLARASNVSLHINMSQVPLLPETYRLADDGCLPGACFTNLEYCEKDVLDAEGLDYTLRMIAFDAQTSGGLLICADEDKASVLLDELISEGMTSAAIIGKITSKAEKLLYINH